MRRRSEQLIDGINLSFVYAKQQTKMSLNDAQ
jgi:hypothetical protein